MTIQNNQNEPKDGKPLSVAKEDSSHWWRDHYCLEDIVTLIVFWILAVVVFTQFFSRYVLNDPFGWTEEVARYLLICVGFLGATVGVRRNTHIFVEVFYRYLPKKIAAFLKSVVDIIRVIFFTTLCYFAIAMMPVMKSQKMTAIPVPVNVIYGVVLFALVIMTLRSIVFAWQRFRGQVVAD
ncbi:MAG: TRAP transporter small permease [Desulfobacterales bacterium]|nr:TRAP transporter small permease [Deltaproteobacteria bacterium]NNK92773.1 TRAP transporter small permease [Desulfobacterales bacterium]